MTYFFPPRRMQADAAAYYLGVSKTKFLSLCIPFKRDGGNVVYDRADLDAYADSLPYEGETAPKPATADTETPKPQPKKWVIG